MEERRVQSPGIHGGDGARRVAARVVLLAPDPPEPGMQPCRPSPCEILSRPRLVFAAVTAFSLLEDGEEGVGCRCFAPRRRCRPAAWPHGHGLRREAP